MRAMLVMGIGTTVSACGSSEARVANDFVLQAVVTEIRETANGARVIVERDLNA